MTCACRAGMVRASANYAPRLAPVTFLRMYASTRVYLVPGGLRLDNLTTTAAGVDVLIENNKG